MSAWYDNKTVGNQLTSQEYNDHVIDQLTRPRIQPYSYLIYQDASNTIYAQNGTTGMTDFYGSDASTVIQSAINALTNGGKIFIKNGTYNISTSIKIFLNDIELEGETRGKYNGTLFNFTGNGNCIEIGTSVLLIWQPVIKSIKILDSGTGNHGIITYANRCVLINVQVSYFEIGIRLNYINGANEAYLEWVGSDHNTYQGIYIEQGDVLLSNIITNNNDVGIILISPISILSGGIQGVNIHSWGNTTSGLKIESVFNCTFANLECENNNTYSVEIRASLHDVSRISIIGGLFWAGIGTSYVRFTNEGYNINDIELIGCNFSNDLTAFNYYSPSGSLLAGRVTGCNFGTTSNIGSYPTTLKFNNNIGYLTENSGSSSGTGAQQSIAHGLAITPTRQQIALTAGSATANPFHSAAPDATYIYVTAANNQPWYWATVGT